MKNILTIICVFFLCTISNSQTDYHKESDISKYLGNWYHEGGVSMKISTSGNSIIVTDLMGGQKTNSFRASLIDGRLRYSNGNDNEYIQFSKEYENILLVGAWSYEYIKDGEDLKIRSKSLTMSDLNTINKFVGSWLGIQYKDIKRECKIFITDENKLIYKDLTNNLTSELTLTDENSLLGSVRYKGWSNDENFKLYFNETGKLTYESYETNIEYQRK